MQTPKPGEYIAVAAIAGVIAVIFYPVVSRVRIRLKPGAVCADHMRILGRAFSQYAQDYDGRLPRATAEGGRYTWRTVIDIYVNGTWSTYMCWDRHESRDPNTAIKGSDGFPNSYAANAGRGSAGLNRGPFSITGRSLSISDIPAPGSTIALCEVEDTAPPVFNIDDPHADLNHPTLYDGHDGASAYLFVDGHAELLRPTATVGYSETYWYAGGSSLSAAGKALLSQAQNSKSP